MSRKYNSSRSKHSGNSGLSFDKLLKAASNSCRNKPGVNKTAGAVGRFGNVCFTSTRSSGLDIDSSGEEESTPTPISSSHKRPRLIESHNHHGHHSHNLPSPLDYYYQPPCPSSSSSCQQQQVHHPLTPPNVQFPIPTATVIKPRKFFKSRGAMEVEKGSGVVVRSEVPVEREPPVPLSFPQKPPAVAKETPVKKPHAKSKRGRPKGGGKAYKTPPPLPLPLATNPNESSSLSCTSPGTGIKLRIFKDKHTSKLRSVADCESSGDAEADDENVGVKRGTRQGRGKGASKNVELIIPKPHIKRVESEDKDTGAGTTRRSKRHHHRHRRSSSSLSESGMPVLNPETVDDIHTKVENEMEQLFGADFEPEEQQQLQTNPAPAPPPPQHHVPLIIPAPIQRSYPNSPEKQPGPSPSAPRDFRSILESDWDDNYDDVEGSPRKLTTGSTPNVSRFQMPDTSEVEQGQFVGDYSASSSLQYTKAPEPIPNPSFNAPLIPRPSSPDLHQAQLPPPLTSKPFNAPYAVRNLLSEITEEDSGSTQPEQLAPAAPAPVPPPPQAPVFKKTSIFKSRNSKESTATTSQSDQCPTTAPNPKKRLALYKHQFGGEEQQRRDDNMATSNAGSRLIDTEEFYDDDMDQPLSLHRVPITKQNFESADSSHSKVLCSSGTKKLFTVIKNVKAVHELQESGEVHEFDGDIWYILSDLKGTNPLATRCLAGSILASRCMEPGFRMHLRAHGTVSEFCRELNDSPNNSVLALITSTVLFILSQDRLNMDLDTESLRLILALAKSNPDGGPLSEESGELVKHKQKAIELVNEMKLKGHAGHIQLDTITASSLSLETLLFLTSKRAGEWVKKELRVLGGLSFIVQEIKKSSEHLQNETGTKMELLMKVDRCLQVMHQLTFNHEENQKYLLGLTDEEMDFQPIDVFVELFSYLISSVDEDYSKELHTTYREVLFSTLRVLVNLTHDYRGIVLGSEIFVSKSTFLPLTLHCIFSLSPKFPDGKGFDLLMHSLCLLLNLLEHSQSNRRLISSMPITSNSATRTLDGLIQLFFLKENEAKKEEASTDDILKQSANDKDKDKEPQNQDKDSAESSSTEKSSSSIIDKLIQTAGRNMENSMIAANVSLIIAYLIMDSQDSIAHVRNSLPGSKFLPFMIQLKKLFNFMSITTAASGLKSISVALKFYSKVDPESYEELKRIIPE